MPMPMPKKGETQDAFMSRCMTMVTNENDNKEKKDKRPRKQMLAMCFSQWERGKSGSSVNENEDEIVEASDEFIKKFLEKYPKYKSYFEEK